MTYRILVSIILAFVLLTVLAPITNALAFDGLTCTLVEHTFTGEYDANGQPIYNDRYNCVNVGNDKGYKYCRWIDEEHLSEYGEMRITKSYYCDSAKRLADLKDTEHKNYFKTLNALENHFGVDAVMLTNDKIKVEVYNERANRWEVYEYKTVDDILGKLTGYWIVSSHK